MRNRLIKKYTLVLVALLTAGVLHSVLNTYLIDNIAHADERVYEKLDPSVVMVLHPEQEGGGTGFVTLYRGEKAIVTNDHVCDVERRGLVRIRRSGEFETFKRIIKRDFRHDLCLIEFSGSRIPPVVLAEQEAHTYSRVYVIGHPHLKPRTPQSGFNTAFMVDHIQYAKRHSDCPLGSTPQKAETFFGVVEFCDLAIRLGVTNILIAPGNSGSPVVNGNNELIGVMNSMDRLSTGGYIPLEDVRQFLTE